MNKGFTINMGAFAKTKMSELKRNTIEMGVTKKTAIPIFVDSDYRLGYIFGSFLACGIANLTDYKKSVRGITIFRPKIGYDYNFDKLKKFLKEVFNLNSTLRGRNLYVYNVPLTKLFFEFGVKRGRHLPEKYMVDNKDFNSGLLDGLNDFHLLEPDVYSKTRNKRVLSKHLQVLHEKLSVDALEKR